MITHHRKEFFKQKRIAAVLAKKKKKKNSIYLHSYDEMLCFDVGYTSRDARFQDKSGFLIFFPLSFSICTKFKGNVDSLDFI